MRTLPRYTYISLLVCLVLSLLPAQARLSVPASPTSDAQADRCADCPFSWQVEHHTIQPAHQIQTTEAPKPKVTSTCGVIESLTYTDLNWDLGCSAGGFSGYFAPENWRKEIPDDDGVDVTGAPNALLVEGANSALFTAASGQSVALRLTLPAEGIIAFDWSKFGGSNFFFSIAINQQSCSPGNFQSGSFVSDPLFPGDELTLQLRANPDAAATVQFRAFDFFTNTTGVTARRWEATCATGQRSTFTQFIGRRHLSLSNVLFPENWDGLEGPLLTGATEASPEITGFPVLDEDGNPATTIDQYPVDAVNSNYRLTYQDEYYWDGQFCIIRRLWRIEDSCQGTTMEETQIIKQVTGPCLDNEDQTAPAPRPGKRATSTDRDFSRNGTDGPWEENVLE